MLIICCRFFYFIHILLYIIYVSYQYVSLIWYMVFTVHDFLHQARRPAKDHCWRGASEGQKLGEESILMLVFLQLCFYVILSGPRAEPKLRCFEVPRCPALLQQGRAHSELGIVSSRHVPHCQLFSVAGDADGGFVDKAGRRFFMFCTALLLQIQAGFAMDYLTTGGALFFSSLKRSASNSSKNTSRVLCCQCKSRAYPVRCWYLDS